jgi:hypothetical protein
LGAAPAAIYDKKIRRHQQKTKLIQNLSSSLISAEKKTEDVKNSGARSKPTAESHICEIFEI